MKCNFLPFFHVDLLLPILGNLRAVCQCWTIFSWITEKHWKDIAIGEGLTVCYEENNKYDPCAMAVYREHGPGNERINVGHIPIELSSTLRFFVKHGGKISAKVRQKLSSKQFGTRWP